MRYEVELKFPVPDLDTVEAKMAAMGVEVLDYREEVDTYYRHPVRDFAATDEALRLRRAGTAGFVTYKGPRVDETTKTRREIDLRLPEGETDGIERWAELFEALGFRPAAEVRKRRRKAFVPWQGRRVEMSLDEVERVGTFVELELVAEDAEVDAARQSILALAAELELKGSERRSYLQLLLEQAE